MHRLSAEKSEEKNPLAGPKRKWEGADLINVWTIETGDGLL